MYIDIDMIQIGIVTQLFSDICTGFMALDLRQNFVSTKYLEQIDRFSTNFIYAFILTRYSLGLLHLIFHAFLSELWPLIYTKFCFRSIFREQIDIISPNFMYPY